MRSTLPVVVLLAVSAAAAHEHCSSVGYLADVREPMIVVTTKECSGDTGVASFRAERVFKVQAAACRDPDATDQKLYQVLLRRTTGNSGDYEIIWVDSAGADSIAAQLLENREVALLRRQCGRAPARAPQPPPAD